jgi:8-oxo-dGTP pyrophosphatase MutT (NUDIX family)
MSDAATPDSSVMAHVFVVRGEEILTLHEAFGSRWWGLPGGHANPGEAPAEAAVRETFEEAGLRIDAPELLRTWAYRGRSGVEHACHTFVARAPRADVRLSDEHAEYAWMTADDYVERHCSLELSAAVPEYAHFFAEVRLDCAALNEHLARLRTAGY